MAIYQKSKFPLTLQGLIGLLTFYKHKEERVYFEINVTLDEQKTANSNQPQPICKRQT
jgi:hypothetical protein